MSMYMVFTVIVQVSTRLPTAVWTDSARTVFSSNASQMPRGVALSLLAQAFAVKVAKAKSQ